MDHPAPDRPHVATVLRSMQSVIEGILEDYMNVWSNEHEPDPRYIGKVIAALRHSPQWQVFTNDNTPHDWTPDASTHLHDENLDAVSAIASPLEQKLASQATQLKATLDATGHDLRLQENAHVILHFEMDTDYHVETEDGYFFNAEMPSEGATFQASATIHLSESVKALLDGHTIAARVQN